MMIRFSLVDQYDYVTVELHEIEAGQLNIAITSVDSDSVVQITSQALLAILRETQCVPIGEHEYVPSNLEVYGRLPADSPLKVCVRCNKVQMHGHVIKET